MRRGRRGEARALCAARGRETPGLALAARLLFFVATLWLAASAARAQEPFDAPEARAIDAQVLQALVEELGPDVDAERLLDALAPRPPAAVGALFDALETGELVRPERRDALERALRAVPAAALARREVDALDRRAVGVALAVLERVGLAPELPRLLALVAPPEDAARLDRELARAFERALAALLARDRAAFASLGRRFDSLHAALRAPAVRAIGDAGGAEALALLGERLGVDDELDLALTMQLHRVAAEVGPPYPWSTLLRVRAALRAPSAELRRESALAAGRFEDVEALPELIELLEDEHAGVRETALWSLRRVAGVELGASPERWRRWHAEELDWWDHEAPALLAAAGRDDEAARVKALAGLATHRLFRHELARELAWLLERPDVALVRQTCSALAGLRSPEPLPALVELLGRDEPELRRAAWLALRAITGRDLPERPEAWAALAKP